MKDIIKIHEDCIKCLGHIEDVQRYIKAGTAMKYNKRLFVKLVGIYETNLNKTKGKWSIL